MKIVPFLFGRLKILFYICSVLIKTLLKMKHLKLTSLPSEIDKKLYLEGMVEAYLESALWTAEDEIGGQTFDNIDLKTKVDAINNCALFLECINYQTQQIENGQMGHDFWLTRNGHGTGFWDRDLGEFGERLTALSKDFPTLNVILGNDEMVYFI